LDSYTVASELVVGKWISSRSAVGGSLSQIYDSFLSFDTMLKDVATTGYEMLKWHNEPPTPPGTAADQS
jgi:hypothetical protein